MKGVGEIWSKGLRVNWDESSVPFPCHFIIIANIKTNQTLSKVKNKTLCKLRRVAWESVLPLFSLNLLRYFPWITKRPMDFSSAWRSCQTQRRLCDKSQWFSMDKSVALLLGNKGCDSENDHNVSQVRLWVSWKQWEACDNSFNGQMLQVFLKQLHQQLM